MIWSLAFINVMSVYRLVSISRNILWLTSCQDEEFCKILPLYIDTPFFLVWTECIQCSLPTQTAYIVEMLYPTKRLRFWEFLALCQAVAISTCSDSLTFFYYDIEKCNVFSTASVNTSRLQEVQRITDTEVVILSS